MTKAGKLEMKWVAMREEKRAVMRVEQKDNMKVGEMVVRSVVDSVLKWAIQMVETRVHKKAELMANLMAEK